RRKPVFLLLRYALSGHTSSLLILSSPQRAHHQLVPFPIPKTVRRPSLVIKYALTNLLEYHRVQAGIII
ncbi:hypothetical protein, partial [Aeromonas veronii]|uniref:hypothetical protein n=1 Tax=Aeromonas veronii TaxID=654 RepID=UPI00366C4343